MANMEKLNEVYRKAIKAYFKGVQPDTLKGIHKRRKYDKKYFDAIEMAEFGSITTLKKGDK